MAWEYVGRQYGTAVASGDITLSGNFNARVGSGYTDFAQNDLLVAVVGYRSNVAFTLPASWILVATQQSSGNTTAGGTGSIASIVMAYIVRGASAPSYVFTRSLGDAAQGLITGFRGGHATPYDTGSSNTLAVASATVTTPTITTAENGELLVAGVCAARPELISDVDAATGATTASGSVVDQTQNPLSNAWLIRRSHGTTLGADLEMCNADAIMTTAGATGTLQATIAQSARHAMVVGAFKLAAVTAGKPTHSMYYQRQRREQRWSKPAQSRIWRLERTLIAPNGAPLKRAA